MVKRKNRIIFEAKITVETTLIMPIVIFIVISLILLAMGMHDLCLINISADKAIEKTLHIVNDNYDINNDAIRCGEDTRCRLIRNTYKKLTGNYEEEVSTVIDYIGNELNEGLMIYKKMKVDVSIRGGKVKVNITARNVFEEFPLIRNINEEVIVEKEKTILDESEIARLTQCLEE